MPCFTISTQLSAFCFCLFMWMWCSCHCQARFHHHQHHHLKHAAPAPHFSPSPSPSPLPLPSPSHSPSPSYESNGRIVFDVREYGGVGDGLADDTNAFKEAWDAACQTESATLLVPPAYTFIIQSTIFTGPCHSHFVFQVDGAVIAPDGPEMWGKNMSRRQWLVFYKMEDMSFQGTGLIDGRGEQWWNLPCKPHKGPNGSTLQGPCDSPIAIRFFMSKNLRIQGVRMKDSPQFHLRFDGCTNVRIESISIAAPALSPNTDGIHIENTNDVHIYNSIISNGDDCVSIGSGCYDVDIRNITCGPGGHGISIGSLGNHNSEACVSNITVRESSIKESDNGVRIKTWQGGYGWVRGVRFDKIRMENVRNAIMIDQFYCLSRKCSNQTSGVLVSDIEYSNIKGTYNPRSPPMHLACSDTVPCTNISLSDVELLPAEGDFLLDPFCWNAYGHLNTITIPPLYSCLLQGAPTSFTQTYNIPHCTT